MLAIIKHKRIGNKSLFYFNQMVNSGTNGSNTVRFQNMLLVANYINEFGSREGELGGDVYFDITVRK